METVSHTLLVGIYELLSIWGRLRVALMCPSRCISGAPLGCITLHHVPTRRVVGPSEPLHVLLEGLRREAG